jgi:hypothetical protein
MRKALEFWKKVDLPSFANNMMRYFAALMLFGATAAHADNYALYDGATGVTRDHYNAGATFRWRSKGGDWLDAQGAVNGLVPFSSAEIRARQTGEVVLDATAVMYSDGVFLRGDGLITFASRETTTAPRLVVTSTDGSVESFTPLADSTIDMSTSYSAGKRTTLSPMAVLKFPYIGKCAVSAQLVLTIVNAQTKGSVGIMALSIPKSSAPLDVAGYSSQFANDVGILAHPSTLYAENFDVGEVENWWTRAPPAMKDKPSRWTTDGGLFPWDPFRDIKRVPDGVQGTQALGQTIQANALWGTGIPTYYPIAAIGTELEEVYVRYYLRFDANWRDTPVCDGGKLPGITSSTEFCGNSGRPADGYCGWSFRQEFKMLCDANNPVYPQVVVTIYAYHAGQAGLYGDILAGTPVPLGEWQCVEERVKVNTPGQADGIVQQWINNRLVIDRSDFVMRASLDDAHPAYLPGGNLGIQKAPWGTHHWGGKNPPGKMVNSTFDNVVTATERIGCLSN